MKYCKNHPDRKVFARGFCIYCYRTEYLLPKQRLKPKKSVKINNYSAKRVLINKEYDRLKKAKNKLLIEQGKFQCFFTGEKFDTKSEPDYHHLLGRDGELLIDFTFCFPVFSIPHRQFHDLQHSKEYLDRIPWYWSWLKRMETEFPIIYWKEMNKIERSNTKIRRL